MIRKLALILTLIAAACVPAPARPPAGFVAFSFPGDVDFVSGGMAPEFLTGAYVKSATVSGDTLTIQAQGVDGHDLADVTFTGVSEWIHLDDTPAGITADLCVKGNSAGDGLVFGPCLSAGTSDGVVQGMTLVGAVLTLTRSAGLSNLTVTLPFKTDAQVDARIAPYARISPSGTIGDPQIPSTIARDSEIDPRIATYARIAPTGTIPDAQVPATFTRDTEVQDSCIDLTYAGSTLSCVQRDGSTETVTITTTGTTDGVVTAGSISGTTMTLTRSQGLPVVTISGLPVDTNTQRTDADIDARVAAWARAVSPTGTAPAARLGAGTANSTTFLAGDSQWRTVTTGGAANTISTSTPQPVENSGSAGSTGEVSDAGHEHAYGFSNVGANSPGATQASSSTFGTSAWAARANHGHGLTSDVRNRLLPTTGANGDLLARGTSQWNTVVTGGVARLLPTSPSDGDIPKYNSNTATWENVGGVGALSDTDPLSTGGTAAAEGTGTAASRDDHRHQLAFSNVSANSPGATRLNTSAYGTSAWAARADHWHDLTSDLQARLLPASPSDNQIAQYDSGSSSWQAVALPTGGTSDGVANSLNLGVSGQTLTVTIGRSLGANLQDTVELPAATGDITAVATANNSGLAGGADTGDVSLTLDIDNLPNYVQSVAIDDDFALMNESVVGNPTQKVDVGTLFTQLAGDGMTFDAVNVELDVTGGGGGATAFTGLTDTPGSYTDEAGRMLRVNRGETALEFVDEPVQVHDLPHVARLPDPTDADAPVAVLLTHDVIDGDREDATLDVGRSGSQCGFSDGQIFGSFGGINKPSPIELIFGVWDGTDSTCNLSTIHSINEGFIDDIRTIAYSAGANTGTCQLGTRFQEFGHSTKRILSCPDLSAVALGDMTFNLLYGDGVSAYFTDGSVTDLAGIYELAGTPRVYHDVRPIEESHRDGMGSAACGDAEPPDDGAQVCIDDDGRAYFSTDRALLFEQDPEITATAEFMSDYWLGESSDVIGFNNTGENGEFKWYTAGDLFFQIQGTRATATLDITGTANTVIPSGTVFERSDVTSTTHVRTTAEATIPAGGVINNVPVEAVSAGATGNNIPPTSTWVPDPAVAGITSAIIQTGFSGGTGTGLDSATWPEIWEWIASVDDGDSAADQAIHEALRDNSVFMGEFSQQQDAAEDRDGYDVATDRYFYILHGDEGTLLEVTGFTAGISEERTEHQWRGPVTTIEDVHDVFEPNSTEDATGTLGNLRVGDDVLSVLGDDDIFVVGPNPLRAAAEADFNTDNANSNVLGFDGRETQRVARRATATATGTWTQVPSGTSITGTIFRWRGTHYQDYTLSGPVVLDVYHNRHTGCRRYYVGRWEACSYSTIFAGTTYLGEHFGSQQEATDHASENGDYAIITEGGVPHLQILSDFVPAGTYDYYWTPTFTHQRLPDPIAIEYPFPAITNADDNLFYAHRTTDNHNFEVGFPARGTGDVWTMDVGEEDVAGEDNNHFGFVGGEGALSPSAGNISFIYWRDSATESEQSIQVGLTDGGLIDNTLDDGDLRLRFQRHHDVDQYADETEWVTYTLSRRNAGDNAHWQTANITDNPFDVLNRDWWIAVEHQDDGGTWTRYAHGQIARFQTLLDDHDRSDTTPEHTNAGTDGSPGTSNLLARADHVHPGPEYLHRRVHTNTQNAFIGTGITLNRGAVVYGVAEDGGDVPDYVYVATYAHLLDVNDASVGDQPTENNGGVNGNSFRPESHLTGDTDANFMFGTTSGSSPQLLISRLRGSHDTPTYVDLYVFGGQGSSGSSGGAVAGDNAWPWAEDGNDDPIPLAKLSEAPGDITAITTPSDSGIDLSGCTSGSCEIELEVDDLSSLGLGALTSGDDMIVADGSDEYKVTLGNVADYTLGRINNLTDVSDLEIGDRFVINDDDDGDAPKDITASSVANWIGARLAGDNLTYNTTTNQLDAEAGSGGGGTPAMAEALYDNTAGTALSRTAGAWSWANDLQLPLTRALTADDDNKLMLLELTFTSTRTSPAPSADITRSFSLHISPRQFRDLASNNATTGTTITASTEFIHMLGIRFRNSDPTFGTAARNSIITRQRHTDGHDVLRIILNTDSQSVAISDVFARVMLMPVVGTAAPAGGGGLLQQKYVLSNTTNSTLADGTWTTLMSQAVTLAGATDRVFVHATVNFQFLTSGDAECDVRVTRGTTQVGTVAGGAAYVTQEIHPVTLIVIDDSPGAGTYTYNVQVEDAHGDGTCQVNPQGTGSFAELEVLGANP